MHLGRALNQTTNFVAKNNDAHLLTLNPTLSPRDPNFPAWWEEHKAEWEQPQGKVLRKRGGQEPGDN